MSLLCWLGAPEKLLRTNLIEARWTPHLGNNASQCDPSCCSPGAVANGLCKGGHVALPTDHVALEDRQHDDLGNNRVTVYYNTK